jgi:AAA-like domain
MLSGMPPETSMNLDSLLEMVNHQLIESQTRPLNSTEVLLLKGIWQYQTYHQIAQEAGYSPGYITNIVAPEMCQRLSALVGERVTKKNCRVLLESYTSGQAKAKALPPERPVITDQDRLPCYPNGSVPLDSPFYIERSPTEEQISQEIRKPGALVRIKGPQEMGKTSLLLRILDDAERVGCRTVSVNLEQIDQTILSDLNRFLRWLCTDVSRQLGLEPILDEFWDEDMGSKVSCSFYFRSYLLELTESPIVLAFDEVNHIFEYPHVAKDFLPLLRSWYEEAKRLPVWQKLRLIVVHSTEIYVPLQLNQSPFNVGLPIQLEGISLEEVQQLAQRYKLDWTEGEARQLMNLVEGHPALINIALYHLSQGGKPLPQLLESAPTSSGIYNHHLQRHSAALEEQPELASALHTVMDATGPVSLEPILAYKLSSMGLIKPLGRNVVPGCELYRQYFQNN